MLIRAHIIVALILLLPVTGSTRAAELGAAGSEIMTSPAGVPCKCRYQGRDVLFGRTVCMKTSKGYVQARCSRYLNNTSWDISSRSCDIVSLPQSDNNL